MWVPEMIFGTLLTSSNYDDSERKVTGLLLLFFFFHLFTGGRNGYGAKLCNIFSKEFIVETSCKEYGKAFKQVLCFKFCCFFIHFLQTWTNNMGKTDKPKITSAL